MTALTTRCPILDSSGGAMKNGLFTRPSAQHVPHILTAHRALLPFAFCLLLFAFCLLLSAFCLLPFAFASAAPPAPAWRLAPRYNRGMELAYRGTLMEEVVGGRATYQQPSDLELRLLVVDVHPTGEADLACYSVLRRPGTRTRATRAPETGLLAVQLDRFVALRDGTLQRRPDTPNTTPAPTAPRTQPAASFHATVLPVLDLAQQAPVFVPPAKAVAVGDRWDGRKTPDGTCVYHVLGIDRVAGQNCLKVSLEWVPAAGRAPQPAIVDRAETLWIDPRSGFVHRLQRRLDFADPADPALIRRVRSDYRLPRAPPDPGGPPAQRPPA